MICMPALRAAGIAYLRSWSQAERPAETEGCPSAGLRKRFCISMMTRADWAGETVIGVVEVWKVTTFGDDGLRSKPLLVS